MLGAISLEAWMRGVIRINAGIVQLPVRISVREVLRYLGHVVPRPSGSASEAELDRMAMQAIPPRIADLIEEAAAWARGHLKPKGLYRTFAILSQMDAGCFNEVGLGPDGDNQAARITVRSSQVVKLLINSQKASLTAVTLGPELDLMIEDLTAAGRMAEATIYDSVGSDAAEGAAEALHQLLACIAQREGYSLTRRFSPGYGDLPLSFQQSLLDAVAAARIGISMTPAYMLVPQKTVTTIAGWQPEAGAQAGARARSEDQEQDQDQGHTLAHQSHTCAACGLLECQFRREVL